MWMKQNLTISLFNNSKKLVQILFEFGQQIVEGYELTRLLRGFAEKDPFSQPKPAM